MMVQPSVHLDALQIPKSNTDVVKLIILEIFGEMFTTCLDKNTEIVLKIRKFTRP